MNCFIQSCHLVLENGVRAELVFYMTKRSDLYRPYGIRSVLRYDDGSIIEENCVNNCYATQEEVQKIVQMLCEQLVMPCTLSDVIA